MAIFASRQRSKQSSPAPRSGGHRAAGPQLSAAVTHAIEPLESRVLLAATFGAVDANGVLTVTGTSGDDTIAVAQSGSSVTVTFNGASAAFAGVTALVVNANDGDDSVTLGTDVTLASTLTGGNGNDTIVGGLGADVINGGKGIDVVDYSGRTEDLEILLDGAVGAGGLTTSGANGGGEGDVITNVEHAVGGSGNDEIKGNGPTDYTLDGNGGNDTLIGSDGDDILNGGNGNDTLDGKAGADLYNGGKGVDTADYRFRTEKLVLRIDGVADSGSATGKSGKTSEGDTIGLDVERVVGGSGDDLIVGSDSDNSLDGGAGNDTILGNGGNDSIDGGAGTDSIDGGDGDDVLTAGPNSAGGDTLLGGAGNDSFIANNGLPDTLDGGAGTDTAVADTALDTFISIEAGPSVPAPQVNLSLNGGNVAIGQTINFGSASQAATAPIFTFTIQNSGSANLTVGSVTAPTGFTLVDVPAGVVVPGASTTFALRLDTSTAGTKSGSVTFATNDPNAKSIAFTVTGTVTAVVVPDLTVLLGTTVLANPAATPISFGSVVSGALGSTRTFTLRNDGNGVLSIGGVTLPAGYTLVSGPASSVAAGASTSFTVRLLSSTVGATAGSISITSNDSTNSPFVIPVTGVVTAAPAPKITLLQGTSALPDNDPAGVDFGSAVLNATGPTRVFTIRNDGNAVLTVGTVSAPAGFILVTTPPANIAAGASASFTVQLDTSNGGPQAGSISFVDGDATASPFEINVRGTVTGGPQPHLGVAILGRKGRTTNIANGAGTVVALGTVLVGSAGPAATFILKNDGTSLLRLGTITLPAGFNVVTAPATKLLPGATTTLVVALSTSAAVSAGGQIQIASDDLDATTFTIPLSGTVVAPAPSLVVSMARKHRHAVQVASAGGSINFGTVFTGQVGPAMTFIVSNTGTARMRTYGMSIPDGFALTSGLPRYIAAGASAAFTVQLTTRSAGLFSGNISLPTTDVAHSPFVIPVSGQVDTQPAAGGVFATFASGVLTVTGSPGDDAIVVGGRSGAVYITNRGQSVGGSPFSGVTKIVVNAGDGNDLVQVNSAINGTLNGENGNDTLIGGPANDLLNGGEGNDTLTGGGVASTLLGGNGNDSLAAGLAASVLKGEAGDDFLNSQNGLADQLIDGGPGNDVIHRDRLDPSSGT